MNVSTDKLLNSAVAFNKAHDSYHQTFREHLNCLRELEEGDFWQLQYDFTSDMFRYGRTSYVAATRLFKHTNGDGLIALGLARKTEDSVFRTEDDIMRFIQTWRMKEDRAIVICQALGFIPDTMAYGIVASSREVWDMLFNGKFTSSEDLMHSYNELAEERYSNRSVSSLLMDLEGFSTSEGLERAGQNHIANVAREPGNQHSLKQKGDETSTERDEEAENLPDTREWDEEDGRDSIIGF